VPPKKLPRSRSSQPTIPPSHRLLTVHSWFGTTLLEGPRWFCITPFAIGVRAAQAEPLALEQGGTVPRTQASHPTNATMPPRIPARCMLSDLAAAEDFLCGVVWREERFILPEPVSATGGLHPKLASGRCPACTE